MLDNIPFFPTTITKRIPLPSNARVIAVNGAQTSVGLTKTYLDTLENMPPTVGKLLGIRRGGSLLIGMIVDVAIASPSAAHDHGFHATARLDLLGEIAAVETASARFQRGVTNYPAIGDPATLMTNREARLVYDISRADTINIGTLHQDPSISAFVQVDEMLNKHFALLGTTGSGKSSGLAVILHRDPRGAAAAPHLSARRPQRIWPLLRRARQGLEPAQSQASLLAVQFRGAL